MDRLSTRQAAPARSRVVAALALFVCVLLAPGAARAGGMLDQTSPAPMGSASASFFSNGPTQTFQQQIQCALAGQLAGITLTLSGSVGSTATLAVRKGAAPSAQPVLFQQLVTQTTAAPQALFIDMTASNIMLAAGDLFEMDIKGTNGGLALGGSYIAPPGMPLYPQPLYLSGSPYSPGWRLGFMTYMVSTCTPGAACDDANPCTTNDVCSAGHVCAGTPVVCTAADTCHTAGTCDLQTGTCSHPVVADGTTCDDGNACTKTDTCQAGVCTGAMPVTCPPPDACHDAGTCDPTTGTCSMPPLADGTPCDDGNACTQTDTCKAGVCTGGMAVMCPAPDACHEAGACDMKTGTCAGVPKPDGTPCPGGTCSAGTCQGGASGSGGSSSSSTGGTGGSGSGTGGSGSGTGGSGSGTGGSGSGSPGAKGGCGCRTAPDRSGGAPLAMLLGLGAMMARRRQRRR